MDPILLEEMKEEEDQIVVGDYLIYEKDAVLKTEAFYVTKQTQIKGFIYMKASYILFEPVECEDNEIVITLKIYLSSQEKAEIGAFKAYFDYQDI